MKKALKNLAFTLFPPFTKRGKKLKKYFVKLGLARGFLLDPYYQNWINEIEPYIYLDPIRSEEYKKCVKFSIVVPTYNTKKNYIDQLFHSILNQSYAKWELIIADGSTKEKRAHYIEENCRIDERIIYKKLNKNEGISKNTNKALPFVRGEYIVFVDHDDILNPHALNEVAINIKNEPNIEIIYTDEDKVNNSGTIRYFPHFKPDWSPHQYLNVNWTSHLSIVKTELIKKINGLNSKYDGSQDYDLMLRLLSLPGNRVIKHIPKVLYHWRVTDGSTAGDMDEKSYASKAGAKALKDHLIRNNINAEAKNIKNRPGFYKVVFSHESNNKALIVVNASKDFEENNKEIRRLKDSSSSNISAKFISKHDYDKNINKYQDNLNDEDIIIFINGSYIIRNTKWIDQFEGVLNLEDVRAVAPKIIDFENKILDMGIVKIESKEKVLFKGFNEHDGTFFGHCEWVRDVSRVTGVFYGIKKKNISQSTTKSANSKDTNLYDVIWSHVQAKLIKRSDLDFDHFNINTPTTAVGNFED